MYDFIIILYKIIFDLIMKYDVYEAYIYKCITVHMVKAIHGKQVTVAFVRCYI